MADNETGSLADKLGITRGMEVSIFNAPNYFDVDLGDLPEDVEVNRDAEDAPADLFLIFADRSDEAERAFERAVTNMTPDGIVWFAWPNESPDRESDLDHETLRELFAPMGMVEDGTTSLDDTWSGSRFVVDESAREDWPPGDVRD